MNKDNPYKKNIPGACTVCGKIAYFDQYGNGICKNCGWHNQDSKFTVCANYPNMVSLEEAKELNRQAEKLFDFDSPLKSPLSYDRTLDIMKKALPEGAIPYQLRHTFASVCDEKVKREVVELWMGDSPERL